MWKEKLESCLWNSRHVLRTLGFLSMNLENITLSQSPVVVCGIFILSHQSFQGKWCVSMNTFGYDMEDICLRFRQQNFDCNWNLLHLLKAKDYTVVFPGISHSTRYGNSVNMFWSTNQKQQDTEVFDSAVRLS